MTTARLSQDGLSLIIEIPLLIHLRGGTKVVVAPDGSVVSPSRPPPPDSTLIKAIARGWAWQKMLESGKFQTIQELAKDQRITPSFVARILRLALLSPDIIRHVLDGKPLNKSLADLQKHVPADWAQQRTELLP